MKKLVINCETNEETLVDLTSAEIEQQSIDEAAISE